MSAKMGERTTLCIIWLMVGHGFVGVLDPLFALAMLLQLKF
jgi:hypothetical protein